MCKLLMIPHVPQGYSQAAWEFVRAAHGVQTQADSDGYGYAALSRGGGLFAERWFPAAQAFGGGSASVRLAEKIAASYGPALVPAPVYEHIGDGEGPGSDIAAILVHARRANCARSLRNTHPFVCGTGPYRQGPDGRTFGTTAAMIHNGRIENDAKLTRMFSSCDSEVILHQYTGAAVHEMPERFQSVASVLEGHYALGFIARQEAGRWVVDIVRDDRAKLAAAWIGEIHAVVFCTTEDILDAAARELGWRAPDYFAVRENVLIRHDPFTGEVLAVEGFTPAGRPQPEATAPETDTRLHPLEADRTVQASVV
ncbi:MAG: hypothetical protein KIT79_14875 [Deltaproteobacteria bacterium]|nr:hypothetical protein [Deltaproteobacteria bacterium]